MNKDRQRIIFAKRAGLYDGWYGTALAQSGKGGPAPLTDVAEDGTVGVHVVPYQLRDGC